MADIDPNLLRAIRQMTAKELADFVEGKGELSHNARKLADLNGDGKIDEADILALAKAQLQLANKVTGSFSGMGDLTTEEAVAADRQKDGKVNMADATKLAGDAREANAVAARIKRAKTGQLPPLP